MSSQQIQTLLAPPNTQSSNRKSLAILDEQCMSLDDLDRLDVLVQQTLETSNTLSSQVRFLLVPLTNAAPSA